MPRKRLLSDLVQDSKIETTITVNYTEHVFYSTGHTARDRLVRRTERWSRDGPSAFLGQGAYGTVYRECCGRKLRAVKEVKKYIVVGEELDYTRELEAIVKFSNPRYAYCFVRSHGWFEHGDSVFITMEYLPHGDLQKFLTRPLPEIEARQITSQVLDGLSHMHKNGFVHRDLKPANIMVVTKATDWYVKIADFGISKRRQEGVTTLRTIQQGTLGYAAPEAIGIGGDGNERSYTLAVDMWSLGAVAYKMLTNEALFQNLNDLFRYTSGLLEFPASVLESYNITAEGKDFISSLVSPEPEMRPSSTSTSPHTWIIMTLASDRICGVDDSESYIRQEEKPTVASVASATWSSTEVAIPPVIAAGNETAKPVASSNYVKPFVQDCTDDSEAYHGKCIAADAKFVLVNASDSEPENCPRATERIPCHSEPRASSPKPATPRSISPVDSNAWEDCASDKDDDSDANWDESEISRRLRRQRGNGDEWSLVLPEDASGEDDASNRGTSPANSGELREQIRRLCPTCLKLTEETDMQILQCGHRHCNSCLIRMFRKATVGPTFKLPRCHCGRRIGTCRIQDLVSPGFVKQYRRELKKRSATDMQQVHQREENLASTTRYPKPDNDPKPSQHRTHQTPKPRPPPALSTSNIISPPDSHWEAHQRHYRPAPLGNPSVLTSPSALPPGYIFSPGTSKQQVYPRPPVAASPPAASTSHINSRGASKERDYLGPPKTKPPAAWSSLYEATPGTYQQQTHQRSAANRRPVIQPDARVRSMPSIHQSHSINRLVGRDFYGTFARNFDEDEYVSDRDSVASLFHGEKHSANSPPNTERTAEWVDQLETTKWVGRGTGNTSDKNNIGKQNRARSQYWKKGWHDASDYALGKYDDGTYQKLIKDLENSPKISPADLREYNSGRASAKSLRGY